MVCSYSIALPGGEMMSQRRLVQKSSNSKRKICRPKNTHLSAIGFNRTTVIRQAISLDANSSPRHNNPHHQTSTHPTTTTIPHLFNHIASRHPSSIALLDPHSSPPSSYTFFQLAQAISQLSAGLQSLGLLPSQCVALFSENSSRWLIADQAIMSVGAFDAVRGGGATSPPQELLHILASSQSTGLIVQDEETLNKIIDEVHSQLKFIIVLWTRNDGAITNTTTRVPIYTFNQVMDLGKDSLKRGETISSASSPPPHLATLVYTSGTSGSPKAAALTHSNLLYQINNFSYFLTIRPGDTALSVLPPWHIYERTCTYHILSKGACIIYTRIPKLKDDLKQYTPDHLVCVPLVLQTLHARIVSTLRNGKGSVKRMIAMGLLAAALKYTQAKRVVEGVDLKYAQSSASTWTSVILVWFLAPFKWLFDKLVAKKIRAALGVKKTIISGGGSLSQYLDDFYEAIDIQVLNGWGLTETSPVLACRRVERNVRGTVGMPIPGTELLVVDQESVEKWHKEGAGNGVSDDTLSSSSIKVLPDGQQGLLLARGPGVFLGYYNNPQATARAFIKYHNDDWFDTGDLGWKVPYNKDTANNKMAGCVVLTGRAKDTIVLSSGENVVPQPIEDAIIAGLNPLVKHAVLVGDNHRELGVLLFVDMLDIDTDKLEEVLKVGVKKATNKGPRWERVQAIRVVKVPLSVEDGTLTRTMKPRRAAIIAKYADDVALLVAKLR